MSFRTEHTLTQTNLDLLANTHLYQNELDEKSVEDLQKIFLDILSEEVHGLCYSIYEEGQQPGDIITEAQVRRRMSKLKPHISWIRSFSCIEGNEFIPKVAKEMGIKTLVGAWLGDDKEKNDQEVAALIQMANDGLVDIAAVGNEVLYRNDLPEDELLAYIEQVKKAIPQDIPVGYVDAYYEFSVHPRLSEVCDVILSNCYPFWEGCPYEYSLNHMQQMYHQAKQAGQGKKVIITETGWPSQGQSIKAAVPNDINALKYFINTHLWAKRDNIETFYFASFDESWKVGPEGDVGAHWGIWDKYENLKYV